MEKRKKIIKLLNDIRNKTINTDDGYKELLDILKLTKETILCSGDKLNNHELEYKNDCEVIRDVLVANGYKNAGLVDAYQLWSNYSDSYASGWLLFDHNNDSIFDNIKRYIRAFNHNYDLIE